MGKGAEVGPGGGQALDLPERMRHPLRLSVAVGERGPGVGGQILPLLQEKPGTQSLKCKLFCFFYTGNYFKNK